jgi:soluble lytic murein transglycosylase
MTYWDRPHIFLVLALAIALAGAFALIHLSMPSWYARWWYPLNHGDLIERYAGLYHLDPALVAAVIYEESSFEDSSESDSGAVGLMQLMPETAAWIAAKIGDGKVEPGALKSPETNIQYGCWYLRYLLDRYEGSETLALAAYNGGAENVDKWLAGAQSSGRQFSLVFDIPFSETKNYIYDINKTKEIYRRAYTELAGD